DATNATINKVKFTMAYYLSGSNIEPYWVYINQINAFNITYSDFLDNSGNVYENISYGVDSSLFLEDKFNNITLIRDPSDFSNSHIKIAIDQTHDYGRSYYNSGTDETGEYMIRLVSVSNEITFESTNISKGDHEWNVLCVNNQSQSATSDDNFTLSIQDTPPSVPGYVRCNEAECTGTVSTAGTLTVACGGSTDIDGDTFDYELRYLLDENWNVIGTSDSTFSWDVTNLPDAQVRLRCAPETATSNYNQTDYFTISIPGAPPRLTPENITCNGGYCNNTEFTEDIINITCNTSGNFSYRVEARYVDYNGTNIVEVEDFHPGDGANNISWDTTSIMNQTNVSIWCYVINVIGETKSNETENLTLIKATAPTKPLTHIAYEDGSIVHVNCSGSTGSGTINYSVFASYKDGRYKDSIWRNLGTDQDETTYLEFNGSQIYE
ncbi:unnamed protein product, partial [marine sediment metagenome]